MPKKRKRRRHPPQSPIEQFFSNLRDTAVEFLMDAMDDLEDIRKQQEKAQTKEQATGPQKRTRTSPKPDGVPVWRHHYSTLGVSPDARQEVIQAAYRALSRIYHPDVPKTGDKIKMQRINSAYEVVGDVDKRKEYDRTLR